MADDPPAESLVEKVQKRLADEMVWNDKTKKWEPKR